MRRSPPESYAETYPDRTPSTRSPSPPLPMSPLALIATARCLIRRRTIRGLACLLLAATVSGVGCSLPHDPNGTLVQVRGGTMHVGVSEAAPWVTRDGEVPAGIEVDLVRRFADDLGSEVEWVWGTQEEHLEALERFDLHLVIGGLTRATPWRGRIALSAPYFTDTLRVGLPPHVPDGVAAPRSLDGLRVAVAPGSALAATLEERGAVPVPTDSLPVADLPVAAAAWELKRWGFAPTDLDLGRVPRVVAVPPGENGWLVRLERFLRHHTGDVADALRTEDPP